MGKQIHKVKTVLKYSRRLDQLESLLDCGGHLTSQEFLAIEKEIEQIQATLKKQRTHHPRLRIV